MRARARQKFVAKATALGARVPRAELLVFQKICDGKATKKKGQKNGKKIVYF